MPIYKRPVTKVSDFSNIPAAKYLVLVEDTIRSKEEWYGPPDPQPTGYNSTPYFKTLSFSADDELIQWIGEQENLRDKPVFQIFQVAPISVNKTVSISIK